jgi:hypothetical protein
VRIGQLWGGDLEVGRYQLLGPEEIEKASTNPPEAAPKTVARKDVESAAKKAARKKAALSLPGKPSPRKLGMKKQERGPRTQERRPKGRR